LGLGAWGLGLGCHVSLLPSIYLERKG